MKNSINDYMQEAITEARKAEEFGEVPVGAIIVKDDVIIGRGYNLVKTDKCPTSHAEISAIREASRFMKSERLVDCDMYVTLEPCTMCAGAIVLARIANLYIGAADEKTGACGSVFDLTNSQELNHRINVNFDIEKEECSRMLKDFFKALRNNKKNSKMCYGGITNEKQN